MSDPLLSAHDRALVDAVAERVLELLAERDAPPSGRSRLVSAGELAEVLGLSRSTVYERAAEYGAIPVGDGPRPRLRFDLEKALAGATCRQASEDSQPPDPPDTAGRSRHRRQREPGSDVPLLPVRGRNAGRSPKARTP